MRLSVFIKIFIILILLTVITISVASPATVEEGHLASQNVIVKEAYGVQTNINQNCGHQNVFGTCRAMEW